MIAVHIDGVHFRALHILLSSIMRVRFRGAKVDTQREIVLTLTTEYPVRLTGRATGWRRSSVGATCWDALALPDRRAFH